MERFHSRDQQPYWITETIENICIKIEFNIPFSCRAGTGHWRYATAICDMTTWLITHAQ